MAKDGRLSRVLSLVVALALMLLYLHSPPGADAAGWLSGWRFRQSHIINTNPGAGTDYQVPVYAMFAGNGERIVPHGELVSTLPLAPGTQIISGQSGSYWDGTYLHTWFGATSDGNPINDEIYHTRTSDFVNWDVPVKVIDRPAEGTRDSTVFVEGDTIYLFLQCFDGAVYAPIRLYKVLTSADFTLPLSYSFVGDVIDVGPPGSFDSDQVASATATKIGSTYYLAYEAHGAGGKSLGRAISSSIEATPWTKDGQMRDTGGNVIYAPTGPTSEEATDTWVDSSTFFFHYYDVGRWHVRYIHGDIPGNSLTMSTMDVETKDGYASYANTNIIGYINNTFYFIMQSWDSEVRIRLYRQPGHMVVLNGHSRPDFGDVRFTRSDGTTELSYYTESKADGNYALFWVKISDDLSSGPATIFIYYGKSDAATTSNGWNTFLLFDDFSSLDLGRWDLIFKGAGGDVITQGGTVILVPSAGTSSSVSIRTMATFRNSFAVVFSRKYANGTESYMDASIGGGNVVDENGGSNDWWHTTLQSGYYWFYQASFNSNNGLYVMPPSGAKAPLSLGSSVAQSTSFMRHELVYDGDGRLEWNYGVDWFNSTSFYSATDTTFLVNDKRIMISQGEVFGEAEGDTFVDWLFVRKRLATEPTQGSWGSESQNVAPEMPAFAGPSTGLAGVPQTYFAVTNDSDADQVSYTFDWGDGNASQTGYLDSGIVASHPYAWASSGIYTVKVKATDSKGSSSIWSTPLTVRIGGLPSAPTGLTASGGNAQVLLAWFPPASPGISPIINYSVYRGTNPGGEMLLVKIGNVTSHLDTGLTNGLTYYYQVSAWNADGEGPRSSEASATPMATVPGPPRNLTVTDVLNGITLTWSTPLDDGGSPITNYTVYQGMNGFSEYFLVKLGTVFTFKDTGASYSFPNFYSYHVTANNSLGEGPLSNGVSASPILPPSPLMTIEAIAGDKQVTLEWTEPFEYNGAPVTNYTIYRGMTQGGETPLTTVPYTNLYETYVDSGLVNGQTYHYYVTAWNLAGEGARSSRVNATPATVPGVPTGLTLVPGDGQIALHWSAPADDGGSQVSGYTIYRGTTAGAESLLVTMGNVLAYIDSGLMNGQTYYYLIDASNAMGHGPNSTEASATPIAVPSEPLNLALTAGNAMIVLTWDAPASDGGSPITNYEIFRGTAPAGETLLIEVGSVLTYTDTGLTNGQIYYYEVRAKNAEGEGPKSAEFGATPATTPSEPLDLTATAGDGRVILTWTAPASDGGSPIMNYTIYGGTASGGKTLLATLGNVLSFIDTGVANGQTYYYEVSASNNVGEGPRSSEASATPTTGTGPPSGGKSILEEPWFWAIAIAVFIILVAAVFIGLRKRRRGEKESVIQEDANQTERE